jgi:hypothetical protein
LAAAYAINIIAIYQTYRWNSYVEAHRQDPKVWHGLVDNDAWQAPYLTGAELAETKFWLGDGATAAASAPAEALAPAAGAATAPADELGPESTATSAPNAIHAAHVNGSHPATATTTVKKAPAAKKYAKKTAAAK